MDNLRKLHFPNNWEVIESEQISARTSKVEIPQIKLYNPLKGGRGQVVRSYGKMYDFLRGVDPKKYLMLDVNCLDYLLSHEEQIPEDWKKFDEIQFWGTIFRTQNKERLHLDYLPKMLYMFWKPLLNRWDVGENNMGVYSSGSRTSLDKLYTTISDDDGVNYGVPYIGGEANENR